MAGAHVIQVGHKKKKHHKKPHSKPLLGANFGNVPLGTYQAAYDVTYTGFSGGWVDAGQYTLSSAAVADFKAGISTYNCEYGSRCDSEGTALGISGWSCSETCQSWNGTSFGFSFSASGPTSAGASFTETVAIRYTKIG